MRSVAQLVEHSKTFSCFVDEQCELIRQKLEVSNEVVDDTHTLVVENNIAMKESTRLTDEDLWHVAGVRCSVLGRYCEQCDIEPGDHIIQDGGGILCAHRLAAMIMTKFSQVKPGDSEPGGYVMDLLRDIFTAARKKKKEGLDDVRLKYRIEYTYAAGQEQNIIIYGYQVNYNDEPGAWVYINPPSAVSTFTFEKFLLEIKWCKDWTFEGRNGFQIRDVEFTTAYIPYEEKIEASMVYQAGKENDREVLRDRHRVETEYMRNNPQGNPEMYGFAEKEQGRRMRGGR